MQKYQSSGNVFQQTTALLWKNILQKWRMRVQSFQEGFSSVFLLIAIVLLTLLADLHPHAEIPEAFLGHLDDPSFNITGVKIAYTPDTMMARETMRKIETISVLHGIQTELMEDEKAMEAAEKEEQVIIGVVFQGDVSYRLRFSPFDVVSPSSLIEDIDTCYDFSPEYCTNPKYWFKGFVSLQSSIDSALIERITNHSVWDEMKSMSAIRMESPSFTRLNIFQNLPFYLAMPMCFSPIIYFLSQNVSQEKRKLKEVMKTMGLRDTAFWLSWGLLYAVFVLIISCVLALALNYLYFLLSSFPALFLLFFIYGISSICFCFMISSVLKKPKSTCLVVFILHLFFGVFSIVTLMNLLPAALEWILSIFCPFAFGSGLSKVFRFQKYGKNFYLSELMHEPCLYVLLFDSALYILLTAYFDKVVPDKYGVPYPAFFFLKKSYWCKSRSTYSEDVSVNEQGHGMIFSDKAESVPSEFDGKEVIRLNNIKKTYKVGKMETEALRGLSLNIYEGQITAVLGHSGAGKTTLLNILSGLSQPSDGSATIFTYKITEREDMEEIRKMTAVCPQFNIQFEFLTVKENLKTFAKIKGIPSSEIEKEVQNILTLLDIGAIQDSQANRLSGGQKRKLSLGITFLGDPQVLLLDEPTAGLDPYSRHRVWALLNERKAGRVTLFTTQFMDEADILADRKAFISHGRLKCVGSSLFLKKKWGIGYHLRMHVSELCSPERTTALVKRYIPAAVLSGQRENELSYTLPLEHVDKFPDLFSDMDGQTDLGIVNYGVTMTTLEDVFLRLQGDETVDAEDYGAHHGERGDKGERDQDVLLLSDAGQATMKGAELWRSQVCAMARMHFLNLRRERKVWASLLLLSGIMLAPFFHNLISVHIWLNLHYGELHPRLYFEPGRQSFMGTSGLLILNDTGTSIDNFIHAVKSQNILLEVVSGHNVSGRLVHNGAIKVALEDKKYRFALMCHMEVTHCFPVLVNIISNAFLHMFNSTARLRIWSHTFVGEFDEENMWTYFAQIYIYAAVLLLPAFPPHFTMMSIRDYKIKARSQLRVSGLFPSAYWCGQALVDVPLNLLLLLLVLWPLLVSFHHIQRLDIVITCLVSFLIGYSISCTSFLYTVAFLFRNKISTSTVWAFIFVMVNLIALLLNFGIVLFDEDVSFYILTVFFPMYPAISFITELAMLTFRAIPEEMIIYEKAFWMSSFMPFVHGVVCILLLRCLVTRYGRPVMRRDPVFRISAQRKHSPPNPEKPPEDDDRDVQEERARAQSALASAGREGQPVIVVHNLRKEYQGGRSCSCRCFKHKAGNKVATRMVSFCVKRGEVVGLLGPNGAGKSTTMNMIIGDMDPTAGQMLIKGADVAAREENAIGFLGHCPQENALWSNLTVREHLEIYAAVKGIRKGVAAIAIDRIAEALGIREHLNKTTKTLAAGLSRKLCFALSILGNPTVMLLDEPTAGMDPNGKRQVWKAMQAILKDKDQGVILTTHHMEEAEAVCDRVAIMVAGQLRCLGSIQYLKSKFGKNYLLQIKVKGIEQGELLNTRILQMFPQAARQERISTLLVYKIPMEDALPLSKAFSMLEEAKRSFNFEEYSFSLNTLEQVFLELCREEERDNFDTALGTTFEWKQLQSVGP